MFNLEMIDFTDIFPYMLRFVVPSTTGSGHLQVQMSGRESEQLLLSKLCDRGAALQPQSLVITKPLWCKEVKLFSCRLERPP